MHDRDSSRGHQPECLRRARQPVLVARSSAPHERPGHAALQGSEHHKNEQRKMAITESRIQRMKAEASRLTRDQLNTMERCRPWRLAALG